jgi:gamma-glutamyltranspeptidase
MRRLRRSAVDTGSTSVCVPPPPSSGVALLQVLGILEHTDIATRGPNDAQAWLEFADALRLMYADRDRYVADLRSSSAGWTRCSTRRTLRHAPR